MNTILLIEDNDMMRENTTEILELSNYRVLPAANGWRAIELAVNNDPDLIICDMTMLETDGIEIFKKLDETASSKKIPFIFLTLRSEKPEISNVTVFASNESLTKPYLGDELLRVVAKYLPV